MLNLKITPIVSEKSSKDATLGKYHFYVPQTATKIDVAREVAHQYGREVDAVNIVATRKKYRVAGKRKAVVKRQAKKKAIVTFKDKSVK